MRSPAIEIVSLSYLDSDGNEQVVPPTDYRLDSGSLRPSVHASAGGSLPSGTFESSDAIRASFSAGGHIRFTVDETANTITPSDNRFTDDDRIRFSNHSGNLPTPIDDTVDYFVVNRTNASFQIALTAAGAAIDLTDDATGIPVIDYMTAGFAQCILMLASYWYENPESFSVKNVHNELGTRLSDLIITAGGQISYA